MHLSFPKYLAVLALALFVAVPVFAADTFGDDLLIAQYEGEDVLNIHPVDDAEHLAEEIEEEIGYMAEESHEHADDHGDAHAQAGLPQMDTSWYPSQIFWLAITFISLYLIFSKKLLPEISSTLENRRTQIEGDISSAQDLKEEAEGVQAAYEDILASTREEASALFNKADETIRKKTEKKTQGFLLTSARAIEDAEAEIAEAKKAAMLDMHTIAAEISSIAAEKIIGVSTDINQAKDLVKTIDKKKAA